jgi:hypothetical protein
LGNVATHPAARGRGIAARLVQHAIDAACGAKESRTVALQVLEGNFGAARLYRQFGFTAVGAVTRFLRRPSWPLPDAQPASDIRNARGSDRARIAQLAWLNTPDALRHADPFDEAPYQLGFGRWLLNSLTGNRTAWFLSPSGAVRVQANLEPGARAHVMELLLAEGETGDCGSALVQRGLRHLDRYIDRPVIATAPRHVPAVGHCLRGAGFQPLATYVHMLLQKS